MKINLKVLWKNKWKIITGVLNTWFPTKYVEKIAQERLRICKSNVCGYYEPVGAGEKCVMSGKGCCGGCGCNDVYKTHSLSSHCYLKDIGKTPLWDAVMSQSEELEFRNKTGIKNGG